MGAVWYPFRALKRLTAAKLAKLDEASLLELRICDLAPALDTGLIEERFDRLYEELEHRGLDFRPHFWFGEEWFSPDGVPGIGVPFYLGHPRLMRLERKQMLEVEGGPEKWCMKILRHEAAHTIDTAFRLRRRKGYREHFGRVTQKYPDFYKPKPNSRNFVQHLGMWYAQAHPIEDFAETFAVWLKPRSRWRSQYRGWPAMKKLEYMDELMKSLEGEKPVVTSRRRIEPVRTLRSKLRTHYTKKRDHYGMDLPGFFEGDLRRLFGDDPACAKNPPAVGFLKRVRPTIRATVARWTGQYQYAIDQVLHEMIQICREKKLRLRTDEDDALRDTIVLVTVKTMNYLHGGRHRVAL